MFRMASRACYLRSVNSEKRINLPHLQPVTIGRNEETGVTDLHISRKHLECVANLDTSQLVLKTLGKTFSGCNGYALMKNEKYTLKNGDRIEIRLGFHAFDIVFEPLSEDDDEEDEESSRPPKKQKLLDPNPIFGLAQPSTSTRKFDTKGTWEEIDGRDLLIYTCEECEPRQAIAGFDLDGTLIKTKSGARFPKDPQDWVINFNNIPQKLHQLHDQNHKIVIFTNQSGLGNDLSKIPGFKSKIEAIVAKIGVPMQVFIATNRSIHRKPCPGMWNAMVTKNNNFVDLTKSFYVGDAAGREKNWAPKKNKDHSTADRLFALNIGLKFQTPEEYFLKASPVPFTMPEFDPRNKLSGDYPEIRTTKQDVIIMVGGPGSGKSFYCRSQLIPKGYVHVSRDKLGSWQKCAKVLEECIQRKECVVIDNTNPDKESRQRFIDIAKRYGINCKCFVMNTSFKHTKHNNRFRELTDKDHLTVGNMVLNSFKKSYQDPEISEGFTQVVKVPFLPKFDNAEQEKLYNMFLVES